MNDKALIVLLLLLPIPLYLLLAGIVIGAVWWLIVWVVDSITFIVRWFTGKL